MLQWIIASVIVIAAFVWAAVRIIKSLKRAASSKADPCGSCASDCKGCALPPEIREAAEKRKQQLEEERKGTDSLQ